MTLLFPVARGGVPVGSTASDNGDAGPNGTGGPAPGATMRSTKTLVVTLFVLVASASCGSDSKMTAADDAATGASDGRSLASGPHRTQQLPRHPLMRGMREE